MNWIEYHSIKELPETIWAKIAGDNPCLSADFMEIVENLHPKDSYNYAVLYDNKEVVGVIFYSIFNVLSSTLMKLSIGRVLMTGTFETYGKHWWCNTSYISECDFFEMFWQLIRKQNVLAFVIRDFVCNECQINKFFGLHSFEHIIPYSVSWIKLNDSCMNLDDFLCEMSKKHRNMYKKIIKSRNDQNISFRKEYDISKNLHKLYPLYINVNKRAKEFKSPPIPSSFFTGLERKFGHNCFCIIMSVGNKDIGFVLIIQGTDIIIPFLMGIDYKYRELHVWHNLTIECVRYAIETRITNIDLGLTNFELKKRLGAKKININMFARFKNNVVNRFCKSFLSKLL